MSWKEIINQEKIKIFFQKVLKEKTLSNAYCFFGIEGVGKFALALNIIKTYSCLQPKIEGDFLEPCEGCSNCLSIRSLKFPNVEYIFSLPSFKTQEKEGDSIYSSLSDSVIEEMNSKLRNKINNPYVKFAIEGANQIRIAQIRELRKSLALSNSFPGRKFIVIFNAEDMRVEAQNAFLKTLEEPREDITFFLLTTRRESLLPTILSRCQSIFFPPLSDDEVFFYLIRNFNKSENELRIVSRFANGSITKAIELVESNLKETRDYLVNILRFALKKELPGKQLIESIEKFAENLDKKGAQSCLQLLANWIRDAILLTQNGTNNLIVNLDDLDTLKRFSEKFGNKPLGSAIEIIENCNLMINSNVQIPNVFINLFLELRKLLL
ncbi:MAG: hypothetical protein N2560_09370 [Ignavibacteria bacterium]|nr:hypothetical protein [Ignavibacteria bacterium]